MTTKNLVCFQQTSDHYGLTEYIIYQVALVFQMFIFGYYGSQILHEVGTYFYL